MIGSPPPLEIFEHLSYDERTGIFTRIKSSVQNSRALDAITHGTASRGERHGCAVLTEEDVHLIRALRGRIGQRVLAAHFGVSHSTIGHIHTRRLWRWLPDTLEDLEREASDLAARIQAKKAGREMK